MTYKTNIFKEVKAMTEWEKESVESSINGMTIEEKCVVWNKLMSDETFLELLKTELKNVNESNHYQLRLNN